MILGERIKTERLKRGMSQQQLGDMLGVTKVSICGYENGTRVPSLETFIELVKILDVTPDYLLGRDVSVVSENDEPYNVYLAKKDLEIIEVLKNHPDIYNKLLENPKRTLELISLKLKK